jgi:hypothetical protein
MADPDEGVAADGTIRTGARRDRVPAIFEPVMTDAVALAAKSAPASLYVYGSVPNGTARAGSSDVDLLSIGLPDASILGQRLAARYAGLCRGVEVAAATAADLVGDTDAAYGYRVFLRHYCVHLAGPDPASALSAFPADTRAARGIRHGGRVEDHDADHRVVGHEQGRAVQGQRSGAGVAEPLEPALGACHVAASPELG